MPTAEKSKTYKENMEHIRGTSWNSKLKVAVDKAIWSSLTYEEFLMKMKASGYEIMEGKNLAFRRCISSVTEEMIDACRQSGMVLFKS